MPFFYRSSLKDIAFRDTAWSWNLIQGSGMIQLDISKSKGYYLTVANLKRKDVEVELDIDVKVVLYDTKQSSYNCSFSNGECSFKMNERSPVENYAVVTSPALGQGVSIDDEWYIELSYQPRLIAYGSFTGVLLSFMLVAIHFCNKLKCCGGEGFLSEDDSTKVTMIVVMMSKQVTKVSVPFVLMLQEIVVSSRVAIASPVTNAEQSKFFIN
nr:hypothetical protein [Arabidopsis thaliana]